MEKVGKGASRVIAGKNPVGFYLVPLVVEADGVDAIRAEFSQKVHLKLVDGLPAVERSRDEGTLGDALLVPRERDDHPRVVVTDTDLLPVEIHPQRPGTSPKPESPNHGRLRLRHEVRGREELADPVGRLLVLADDLHVLVEKE